MISLGISLSQRFRDGDVVGLTGPLGAGKTVLVKGIARGLDITEPITSPTYTLISEYSGALHLYHVDLYRLAPEDVETLGLDDFMGKRGLTVIEWCERLPEGLPAASTAVTIEMDTRTAGRKVAIIVNDPSETESA